jgi:hypothetical protein
MDVSIASRAERAPGLTNAVGPGATRSSMPEPEKPEARPGFADRGGIVGPYGVRYSWAYWIAVLAALALLIVDIFDDGALWNYLVIALVAIAILIRPGGIRGPRHAGRADEKQRPRV